MAKKINISSLLSAAITEEMTAAETVQDIKDQRNEKKGTDDLRDTEPTSRSTTITVSKTKQDEDQAIRQLKIKALETLLKDQQFSDRKEQFIFRLSQECFEDYETLTRTINYKMNMNLTRNDIMRKVLEAYHKNELMDLLKIL